MKVGGEVDDAIAEIIIIIHLLKITLIWVFPKIGVFPPKSSILIGFGVWNHYFHHPFWGENPPIFGSTPICSHFHVAFTIYICVSILPCAISVSLDLDPQLGQ